MEGTVKDYWKKAMRETIEDHWENYGIIVTDIALSCYCHEYSNIRGHAFMRREKLLPEGIPSATRFDLNLQEIKFSLIYLHHPNHNLT